MLSIVFHIGNQLMLLEFVSDVVSKTWHCSFMIICAGRRKPLFGMVSQVSTQNEVNPGGIFSSLQIRIESNFVLKFGWKANQKRFGCFSNQVLLQLVCNLLRKRDPT